MKGDFKHVSPLDLFLKISEGKLTGALKIQRDNVKKVVYFIEGKPVSVLSNLKKETLGQILLKLGRISQQELDEALKEHGKKNRKLGSIFVEKGIISASDLRTILKKQNTMKLREICQWDRGKFIFQELPQDEIRKQVTVVPISLSQAIIASLVKNSSSQTAEDLLQKLKDGSLKIKGDAIDVLEQKGIATESVKKIIMEITESPEKIRKLFDEFDEKVILGWILLLQKLDLLEEIEKASTPQTEETVDEKYEKFGEEIIDDPELYEKYQELKKKNYYEILGISQDASKAEIKRAYFKLAREMHPDRFFDPVKKRPKREAELIFALINEAFQTLYDEEKRKEYDEFLRTGKTQEDRIREAENAIKAETEFEKGKILLRNRNIQGALECFKTAYELVKDPEFEAYYGWTLFLDRYRKKSEEWKEGEKLLRDSVKAKPDLPVSHLFLAKILNATGRMREAFEEFNRVLQLDPENIEAKRELSILKKKVEKEGKSGKDKGGIFGKLFKKE